MKKQKQKPACGVVMAIVLEEVNGISVLKSRVNTEMLIEHVDPYHLLASLDIFRRQVEDFILADRHYTVDATEAGKESEE